MSRLCYAARSMRIRTPSLLVLAALGGPAVGASEWSLPPEAWARPRDGAYVAGLAPVRAAVRAWMSAPDGSTLTIRYPGGEDGLIWASELRDWLVALGVPPAAVSLVPGAGGEGLRLALEGP